MTTEDNILTGLPMEETEQTLGEYILNNLKLYTDRPLWIDSETGQTWSAHDIVVKTVAVARWLKDQNLNGDGAVSICTENRIEFFVPIFAAMYQAVAVAPFNQMYTIQEQQHALNLSKPKIIFCSESVVKQMLKLADENNFVEKVVVFDRRCKIKHRKLFFYDDIIKMYIDKPIDSYVPVIENIDNNDQVATIMLSSGTSGPFKGVMLTHRNYLALISNAKLAVLINEKQANDYYLNAVPLFHSMGFSSTLMVTAIGQKTIFMKKFVLDKYLQLVQKFKISRLSLPPAAVNVLAKHPDVEKYNLSHGIDIFVGSAPLGKSLQERTKNRIKNSKVLQAYGLTETTLGVLYCLPTGIEKLGSVGTLVPGTDAKVVDENGKALGPNQEGELCFKGALIMKGYINDPKATADTIDKDGWLHTGDIGYYDEDFYFYVVDRLKELIKYKSFQVSPSELETILLDHPAVADTAVVGIPDEEAGEIPIAFVVKQPKNKITANELTDYVNSKVSYAKKLRGGVKFIDEIPRNATNKILRRVLRDMVVNKKSKL